MKLKRLLSRLTYEILQGTEETETGKITNNTENVEEGDVFVCIKGYRTDGHLFAQEAVKRGASVLVVERKISLLAGVTVVKVADTRHALAYMSAAYYEYPARRLCVIGVTGTKGKTSTAYMIRHILETAGRKTGLIGTIQVDTGIRTFYSGNTTPESCQIQKYLREMVDTGCSTVVMEVSSQGLKFQRTEGMFFDIAVFTNLGKDHIGPGEHTCFEDYKDSKKSLFGQCGVGIGNDDDPYCKEMLSGSWIETITYGKRQTADVNMQNIKQIYEPDYIGMKYNMAGEVKMDVEIPMPGEHNAYNAAAAVCVCHKLGVCDSVISQSLSKVSVPGRMEQIKGLSESMIFVDYAHNAMSLESVLCTCRACEPERIVVVFGCGGNRSKERRYEMGATAGRFADMTIITTDNPRYEEPEKIIKDIVVGIQRTKGKYRVIPDRKEAIDYVINHRKKKDIIIIAGKGHETYQEVKGIQYYMDDRELIREAIQKQKK